MVSFHRAREGLSGDGCCFGTSGLTRSRDCGQKDVGTLNHPGLLGGLVDFVGGGTNAVVD